MIALGAVIQLILYKRCNTVLLFINSKLVWLFFALPISVSLIIAVWATLNINHEVDENRYSGNSGSYDSFGSFD